MVPNNLISLWEKMNLSLTSHQAKTLTQNGSQTNLNVQTKTTKLLEENIGEKFGTLEQAKISQDTKSINDKRKKLINLTSPKYEISAIQKLPLRK